VELTLERWRVLCDRLSPVERRSLAGGAPVILDHVPMSESGDLPM
jgi:hypothetical protein